MARVQMGMPHLLKLYMLNWFDKIIIFVFLKTEPVLVIQFVPHI